ncbi:MAG: ABC transporter substrate-binding protein [Actinomycetales bacterium]|nr:ABC transporter substrate-binding protein [Actinomycetales bacterium]
MSRRTTLLPVAGALSAVLLLAACGGDSGGDSGSTGGGDASSAEILLPFPEGLPLAPVVIAQTNGFFEENGITDVTISVADGSGFLSQQLVAGNAEFAVMGSADIAVAASKRPDVRVLFCNQVNNVYRIVATEDSGITDIQGLAGNSLGITEPGGGENQYVQAALADAQLQTPGDLTVLPVGAAGPQALAAINDGKIQAYSSSFPDIASLAASGVAWVDITPERYSAVPGTCMATTQEVLDSPDGLERAKAVSRSWVQAQYYILENEDEAFEAICDRIASACENEEAAAALYDEALNVIRPDSEGQKPGEVALTSWETVAAILGEAGTVPADLDLTDVVSGETIDEVVAFAYEGL